LRAWSESFIGSLHRPFGIRRPAALAGGGEAEINKTMGGLLEILGIGPSALDSDGQTFDPKLVNCNEDLVLYGRAPGGARSAAQLVPVYSRRARHR
jgi:hypothetical protein